MESSQVLIIGGGIGGLTAAKALASFGIQVDLVEQQPHLGGHAGRYACKAVERCVKCGACLVQAAIEAVSADPRIRIHTACRVQPRPQPSGGFIYQVEPVAGAEHKKRSRRPAPAAAEAQAVILAVGFDGFDPRPKPYGYGLYPNVITNLELEGMLRAEGLAVRPSDREAPRRMAFIQCVGSRDAQLGHLWCSKFCCAAALRTGRRIQAARPQTEITVFYIDIQTFGRDFEAFYRQCRQQMRFVRAIPADAFEVEQGGIRLCYREDASQSSAEEIFDLVVLSAGMVPPKGLTAADHLALPSSRERFAAEAAERGIFVAGAARGPMTIAETISDARHAAAGVLAFLKSDQPLAAVRPPAGADLCRRTIIAYKA